MLGRGSIFLGETTGSILVHSWDSEAEEGDAYSEDSMNSAVVFLGGVDLVWNILSAGLLLETSRKRGRHPSPSCF